MSKFFRIAIKSLASIAGVVILLIVFINLPFSRNLVTGRVNALFRKLELPLNIQTIHRVGLKKVEVEGVSIVDPRGDTIIYAQNVKTHIKLLALTKSKVILDKTDLSGAGVKLLMNYQTRDYTIAEAFKKKNKKNPADPEKKGSKWEVKIQNGILNSVHFFMEDSLSGIRILQDVDELRIKRFRLGLLERELKAHTLKITRSRGNVKISPQLAEKIERKNKVPVPWNYGVKNLGLEDIDFALEQAIDSMLLKFEVEEGVIETRQMDISGKIIDLNELSIKGAHVGIFRGLEARAQENRGKSKTDSFPWNIKSRKVNLERVDLTAGTAGDQAFESPSEGLGMEGLEMKLDDFQISQVDVGMKLKRLAFNLNNGFTLKQMEADLKSNSESTSINMKVETGSSRIDLKGEARLSFFDFLNDPFDLKDGHLQVNDALVSLSDITSFTPILEEMPVYPQFAVSPTGFDARMDMVEGKLTLSEFFLTQKQKFKLSLHGFAEHPFEPSSAVGEMELTLSDINTPWIKELLTGTGIDSLLSDTTDLMLSASISDRFNSPEIVAQLSSNIGMIDLSGHLNFKNRAYYLNSLFGGIHLGGILDIPGLGTFTGSAKIEGSGLSAETVDSKLELLIDSITYNGYTYTQTSIDGTLKPGEYDLILLADDPAFRSTLSLNLLHNDSLFTANASGTLFAQLDRLNFVKDTVSVATDLSATLAKEPNALETGISLHETKLTSPSDSAMLQNIAASYRTDTSNTSLTGEGDFFTMDIQVDKSIHELDGFAASYGNYLRTFVDSVQSYSAKG